MSNLKIPFEVKAVDPRDNKFKRATVVNKTTVTNTYIGGTQVICDLVFEDDTEISKGHPLRFLIIQ